MRRLLREAERSILEDKSGAFWICNTRHRFRVGAKDAPEPDKGHIKYKREKGIELKAPDGKDHVYFMSAVEDEKGALWMASVRFGVWRYDGDQVTRYPVKDGARDITLFSIYQDNRGDVAGLVWCIVAVRAKSPLAPYLSHMMLDWLVDPFL